MKEQAIKYKMIFSKSLSFNSISWIDKIAKDPKLKLWYLLEYVENIVIIN